MSRSARAEIRTSRDWLTVRVAGPQCSVVGDPTGCQVGQAFSESQRRGTVGARRGLAHGGGARPLFRISATQQSSRLARPMQVLAARSAPKFTACFHVFLTRIRDLDYRHRDMSTTRPYESPLRAEQLEQTRLRILEAMADVLADEEVEEVTVPLVAMRARVSVRTVYRHFPTKEALFDAFGEWGGAPRLALMSYPETLDELREMAPAQYRGYEDNAPLMRALLSKRGQEIRARTRRQRLRTFEKAMREVTTTLGPAERRRSSRRLSARERPGLAGDAGPVGARGRGVGQGRRLGGTRPDRRASP